jgi:NAD(P)-dependent dehydrogenase (short-subunit alcohol dehydrogenase family)
VNIGSETGVAPSTNLVHYSASKAAVHALSRGYAQALARTGVTVNTLLVGPTAHPGATAERTRQADEIAELVAFMVADEAGLASGATWRADCGNLTSIS